MKIKSSTVKGKSITEVEGMLTIYTALEAKDLLLKPLSESKELELDLSQVSEIDTAGFQLLILLKREAKSFDVRLQLKNLSACVERVFAQYRVTDSLEPVMITSITDSAAGGQSA